MNSKKKTREGGWGRLRACALKVRESADPALMGEGVQKGSMSFYPQPNDRELNN